jgi:hypothetical protein
MSPDWAGGVAQAPPRTLDAALLWAAARALVGTVTSPAFDMLRIVYASAVRLRLAPRSMLAARDVEAGVDALERCMLGPLARST